MRAVGLLFIAMFGGCYTGVVVNRGVRPYPPKPPSCELTFEYFDEQTAPKLLADYTSVGSLELAWQPDRFEWTQPIQERLRPAACGLGGHLVAYAGLHRYGDDSIANATNGNRWGEFRVFRKKAIGPLDAQTR